MQSSYLGFLRHAQAVFSPVYRDAERPLSDIGKQQVTRLREQLLSSPYQFSLFLCSDAVRTQETATLLAIPELFLQQEVRIKTISQAHWFSLTKLQQRLHEHLTEKAILLIGHNPLISQLASQYASHYYSFHTCSCLLLSLPDQKERFSYNLSSSS